MEKKKPAQVFHFDLYGKREDKYDFLNEYSMKTIAWQTLQPQEPELFFVPKDFEVKEEYDKGCKIDDLFIQNSVGIVTAKDAILVNDLKEKLISNVEEYYKIEANESLIHRISYRPFDDRLIYFDTKIVERSRDKVMQHFLKKNNVGIVFRKQQPDSLDLYLFCSDKIFADGYIRSDSKGGESIAPLYLYPETTTQQNQIDFQNVVTGRDLSLPNRTPNLNMEIVNEMAKGLGLPFVAEKDLTGFQNLSGLKNFAPIDILDYIYAVLHSPSYREKYKEFLKIDFPRVPYPHHVGKGRNVGTGRDLSVLEIQKYFWQLVALGGALRQIHLLESEVVDKLITQYPEDGDNVVVKPIYKEGNVFINETQYFANVPEVAWNFYIGGYQPAQKWLKDRKDRELSYEDILHYQKIIVALTETDKLMKEIDKITL